MNYVEIAGSSKHNYPMHCYICISSWGKVYQDRYSRERFIVHPGYTQIDTVKFESTSYPNQYLRVINEELALSTIADEYHDECLCRFVPVKPMWSKPTSKIKSSMEIKQ